MTGRHELTVKYLDIRDISVALGSFSSAEAKLLENITDMWRSRSRDESTSLALLDIRVSHGLHAESWPTEEDADVGDATLESADACAEEIRLKYPQAMRSRPYFRWILLKSAMLGYRGLRGLTDPYSALEKSCRDFPGLTSHRRDILSFFYIPKKSENPGWPLPEAPIEPNAPIHTVVRASEQLQDLSTQALAYRLLAWRSANPTGIFQKLSLMYSEQGDSRGRLETLLSSYLACEGKTSREWLLAQLEDIDDWTSDFQLRDPPLYFARDFIKRAIEGNLHGAHTDTPLELEDCLYYEWLDDQFQRFVDGDTMQSGELRQHSTALEAHDQNRVKKVHREEVRRPKKEASYDASRQHGETRHGSAWRDLDGSPVVQCYGVVSPDDTKSNVHRSTREFLTKEDQPSMAESSRQKKSNSPNSETGERFAEKMIIIAELDGHDTEVGGLVVLPKDKDGKTSKDAIRDRATSHHRGNKDDENLKGLTLVDHFDGTEPEFLQAVPMVKLENGPALVKNAGHKFHYLPKDRAEHLHGKVGDMDAAGCDDIKSSIDLKDDPFSMRGLGVDIGPHMVHS